jgi:hypothetical protein
MSGEMPLARNLGAMLDCIDTIPELRPIETRPIPLNEYRWPADEWEKMQRIWRGEEE